MWLKSPQEIFELLARILNGRWRIPGWIDEYLRFPKAPAYSGRHTCGLILVFATPPLIEAAPALLHLLDPIDVRLLNLIRRGATDQQAGARLGRSPRWVRYRLARVRKEHGRSVWPGRVHCHPKPIKQR